MPLGHWNWEWNQARSNYSTYDQELLAGMLVLSSQSGLLGSNPIVWLCDQGPVKSLQKGSPPEKAKLKRWLTYLSQFRLTVHHIPGIKNELARKQFHLDLIQVYLKGRQSIFKNVTGQLVVFSTLVSRGCVAQPRLFSS